MTALRIPEAVADRSYKFTQAAWARSAFEGMGVAFSPEYLCLDAEGEIVEAGRLADEPYFAAAKLLAPTVARTPGFSQLAISSSHAHAIHRALTSGSNPRDLKTGPLAIFLEVPTEAGLARARQVLAMHLR